MKKQKSVPIKKLIPSEYNPRKISDKDFEDLKTSLKKFDIVEPAVINTNPDRENVIIGGHQRIKAAKDLGWTDFPCIGINLNQEDEKELNIRLNKNGGEFDFGLLEEHFQVDALVDWGFDSSEIDWGVGKEYNFDELEEELDSYDEIEDITITIIIPRKHVDIVKKWLSNGNDTKPLGMGKGVLKRCELL